VADVLTRGTSSSSSSSSELSLIVRFLYFAGASGGAIAREVRGGREGGRENFQVLTGNSSESLQVFAAASHERPTIGTVGRGRPIHVNTSSDGVCAM
jgi:hypothetical protein